MSAIDPVFGEAIGASADAGACYFDFGTSNREGVRLLTKGLNRSKTEFGGGGVAHETRELCLAE